MGLLLLLYRYFWHFLSFLLNLKIELATNFFASYLIFNAVEYTGFFVSLLFTEPNNVLVFSRELSYLQMPVFYLYILSVCYSDFKLQWKHLWHITPYIIGNIVMTPRFYLGSTAEKIELFANFNLLYESIFAHIALHLQSTIYLIAGFIVLKKAKKIFLENHSSSTIETYTWLFQLLFFTATLYFVAIVKNIFKFFGNQEYFFYSQIVLTVVVLIVVCWYVLKALRYPNLFNGVDSKTRLTFDLIKETKNLDSSFDKEIKELKSFMEIQKPYLNPSLSIRNLAEEIRMNPRDLSVLINQHLNHHFFDFVNEYRIKEAMKILKNPSKKEVTVLEILYEVGFNSKSSFNTAFKKHTGYTPTQYKKIA